MRLENKDFYCLEVSEVVFEKAPEVPFFCGGDAEFLEGPN